MIFSEFAQRSYELERIDTGRYTPEEYDQFLRDIRQVNRFAGDNWTLRATLFREIERAGLSEFSVLDLGAGSGELLRTCAEFGRRTNRRSRLYGLELSERSSRAIREESYGYSEVFPIQGDALNLPFKENSVDYVICSLFTHHFLEKDIATILAGMARLGRRKIYVIDLHRHPGASFMYKLFCSVFVKGILVKTDGALSIKRGFKPLEMLSLAKKAGLESVTVKRHFPFRLVLEAGSNRL